MLPEMVGKIADNCVKNLNSLGVSAFLLTFVAHFTMEPLTTVALLLKE